MINEILNTARKELGYKEGKKNNTKYGADYGLNYNPWCQMFVWWIAEYVGIGKDIIPKTASCPMAYKWFKNRNQVVPVTEAKAGDIIYFTWNNSRNADHVGIVEVVNSNIITTIEGNFNNMVARRNVNKNNKCIFAICRPAYAEESNEDIVVPDTITNIKYVNTTSGLYMRTEPNIVNGKNIAIIPYKKEVVVLVENCNTANGYNWDKIQYDNNVGYSANKYLTNLNSNNLITYIVKNGDTLCKIAKQFNTTWQIIYNNNKEIIGNNPNLIKIGQTLKI